MRSKLSQNAGKSLLAKISSRREIRRGRERLSRVEEKEREREREREREKRFERNVFFEAFTRAAKGEARCAPRAAARPNHSGVGLPPLPFFLNNPLSVSKGPGGGEGGGGGDAARGERGLLRQEEEEEVQGREKEGVQIQQPHQAESRSREQDRQARDNRSHSRSAYARRELQPKVQQGKQLEMSHLARRLPRSSFLR